MFDRMLDIASAFDWLTPMMSFAQDLVNGPPADFGIPENAGWSRNDIRDLLMRYGIRVWGLMYSGEMLIFTVPKAQARWAYYLLQRVGVPILYAPPEVARSLRRRTAKNTNLSAPIDAVLGFLDKLYTGRL